MQFRFSSLLSGSAGGAVILVCGLFLFSIQDVIIKYFSDHYSVLQIVFIRGLVALVFMVGAARLVANKVSLFSRRPGFTLARGLLGFISYTAYYLALAAMPLAEVVAITFTMPLFVTIMSALLLGEVVGKRRWSAVVIGFLGVLIILSPQGEFNGLAVGFAFLASVTYASQTILTRFLSRHDAPLTIAINAIFLFTVSSGILSLLLLAGVIQVTSQHPSLVFFARDWIWPQNIDLALMIFLGVNGAVAFYCLSRAYCISEASAIAPFEFSYILWAVIFGYLLWNEVPGPTTILGMAILIISGLYIWYREFQLDKPAPLVPEVAVAENVIIERR